MPHITATSVAADAAKQSTHAELLAALARGRAVIESSSASDEEVEAAVAANDRVMLLLAELAAKSAVEVAERLLAWKEEVRNGETRASAIFLGSIICAASPLAAPEPTTRECSAAIIQLAIVLRDLAVATGYPEFATRIMHAVAELDRPR